MVLDVVDAPKEASWKLHIHFQISTFLESSITDHSFNLEKALRTTDDGMQLHVYRLKTQNSINIVFSEKGRSTNSEAERLLQ